MGAAANMYVCFVEKLITTKDQIHNWLKRGKDLGASHMLVVCDTWDWEDYPVYVMPENNLPEVANRINRTLVERIMECYDLSMNFDKQLNQHRAWNGWHP